MDLTFYSMNRLSTIDVKWADLHSANNEFLNVVHSNPFYEILAVTQGPVFIQVQHEKLSLQAGEVLLLSPWEEHMGWKPVDESAGFFWVQFALQPSLGRPLTIQEFTTEMNMIHADQSDLRTEGLHSTETILIPRWGKLTHRYRVLSVFEEIRHQLLNPTGYYRLRTSLMLGQILEMIASDLLNHLELQRSFPKSFLIYRRVVNFLDENYKRDLSPEVIEQHLQRKYGYLCNVFKRYSGITMYSYILRLRVQLASHLLATTNASIHDIACMTGYDDPLYFSRCFKKMMSASPSEYRTQQQISKAKSSPPSFHK